MAYPIRHMAVKRPMRGRRLLACAALVAAFPLAGKAQEEAVPDVRSATTQQGWNPYTTLTASGFSFPFTYTGEFLGNPTGGARQGAVYDAVVKAGLHIDLEKFLHWSGASFTLNGLYPHGSSLTRNDVHDLNVLSNIDALHKPRLYEVWLQQDMAGGKFSLRLGQIPMDAEFFISNYGSLFINSAFGTSPTVGLDFGVAVYPVATPGLRVRLAPNDAWSWQTGIFEGNAGDLNGANRYGLRFNLNGRDGLFLISELSYNANPPPPAPADGKQAPPADRPLSGTYKLGGFYQTAKFPDNTTGDEKQGNYGGYGVIDQELWHKPGAPDLGLRGFLQVGFVPSDRNKVQFYCNEGLNYAGLLPGRDKDLCGVAVCYTGVSDSFRDPAGAPAASHYEALVEMTYEAVVTTYLSVQPDFQYILNPGGIYRAHDALVLGLRFNLNF